MKIRVLLGVLACVAAASAAAPKYVFLFIGDGVSTPQRMLAEEYALATGHGELTLNHLPNHATTRTCSASSLVTDSAAAATALACGEKTNNGMIGVGKDGKPLESVLDVARAAGRKIGVVTTVTINHATPAGFCAHRKHRGMLYQIGLDIVNTGYDYFAGGGFDGKQNDKKDPCYKGDLLELAAKNGYVVATNTAGFRAFKPGQKAFYRGADGELQYSIDSDGTEPTLAEMTAKGIELLDGPNGFMMMIEGGKIDHAGHANDAATNLRDVLTLDDAVRVAKAFYEQHASETLILVTGDHETGGMAMGFAGTGYAIHPKRFLCQRCSWEQFAKKVAAAKAEAKKAKKPFGMAEARPLLEKWFGFDFTRQNEASKDRKAGTKFSDKTKVDESRIFLTKADIKALEEGLKRNKLELAAIRVMAAKAGIGWSSGAHTALPVLSTSIGVRSEQFTGLLDNTEISRRLKSFYRE